MERSNVQKMYTDKETITHAEYCQLLGLTILARQHNAAIRALVKAGEQILAVKPDHLGGSHVADSFFGEDYEVDRLLSKFGVTVE
jgi:hypothetical protein